ncbi:MAG: hypothetical protein D6714_03225, partial [Bacteroidetes bacterium]
VIFYAGLWFWNDYIATMLSLAFPAICFFILIISLIAEWIEPSKVPKWYFQVMIVSILAPLVTGIFFVVVLDFGLQWMEKF